MRFEFATATRIIFGAGTLREIGPLARAFGQHALVVTGREARRAEPLLELLERQDGILSSTTCPISGEPTLGQIERAVSAGKAAGCDFVIAIGGGSAMDAGKAVAAMLTNDGELLDYLEVIGRGRALTKLPRPVIAIPTTAGTGAEVTRNAVLAAPEHRLKASLRSPLLLPRLALVDPELTYGLPPAITASTGLDALTQLIEAYVSSRANPMTDAVCVEGMRRAARSLRAVVDDGRNPAAREDMALASLFSGMALANSGLGAVHGLAAPIGGRFAAPHGAVCAALLPQVMTANLRALQARAPQSEAVQRCEAVARLLTGDRQATADDGVNWVNALVTDLRIPRLSHHGIGPDHLEGLVKQAAQSNSLKGNPIVLTVDELTAVLRAAL